MSAVVGVYVATALFLFFGLASTVQAQPPMPAQYVWSKGANSVRLYLHKRGYSLINTTTSTCVGEVEGPIKVIGRTVIMKAKKSVHANVECVLHITFNRAYTRAYVGEGNCSEWHGASCGFNGTLMRQ